MGELKAYDWAYDGHCKPQNGVNYSSMWATFSVGVFQWLPKARGKGLKRGKVVKRFSGPTNHPEIVYQKAEAYIAELCKKGA